MKSQAIPDFGDELQDGTCDIESKNISSNAFFQPSGPSTKIGGGTDQRQTAAMLKHGVAFSPIAAAPSEAR
jgi:hypothetical protein